MIAYGPVPSRRLGRSLGINNIPHKTCPYSCVYCQVGRTRSFRTERREFIDPEKVVEAVRRNLDAATDSEQGVDYLSFVPDGEPTLDMNLGRTIELLKPLGIKIAVITNGSLIQHEDVRIMLRAADWVSLKVDSTIGAVWRRVNRPRPSLRLADILEGMIEFGAHFHGTLVTETMLVRDVNDGDDNLREVASFLGRLQPSVAYVSIPTRPPAEKWVLPPREEAILRAHQMFQETVGQVEHLIGYEGNAFASTGHVEEDLLSITAVHPMREDAVKEFLVRAEVGWSVVQGLVDGGRLVEREYEGRKFYLRGFGTEIGSNGQQEGEE